MGQKQTVAHPGQFFPANTILKEATEQKKGESHQEKPKCDLHTFWDSILIIFLQIL